MKREGFKRFFSARNISYLAVLLALVVVLQLFASAIPMFGVTLNFSLIPIILAGMFCGWIGGGILGFASGMVTFITAAVLGREPSTAFLFQADPVVLTLICIGKTTVAGAVAGLVFRPVARLNSYAGAYTASLLVPVINTGIYMLGMVLMKDDVAAFLGTEATANVVFTAVFGLIWLNFILEIAVSMLLAPVVHRIVLIVRGQIVKNKRYKPVIEEPADEPANEPEEPVQSGEREI